MGLLANQNQAPTVDGQTSLRLSLSWDMTNKPTDLDVQCCLFDSTGLIIDACFYNNRSAANGAMILSGDSRDGAQQGEDEGVAIDLARLPPHAYAIMCGVYCTGSGTLGDCRNIRAQILRVEGGNCVGQLASCQLDDFDGISAVLTCNIQRMNAKEWELNALLSTMRPPTRNFCDALPMMHKLLRVDKATQEEIKRMQPVFNLKKGDSAPVPMGLTEIALGLGWDSGTDVDASIVCLNARKEPTSLVYFGNQRAFDGAIEHSGDNRTGEGDGDDETILLHLNRIPSDTTHCFLVINVYSRSKDFRDVKNEFVRVYNNDRNAQDYKKEFLKYNSLDDNGAMNGVVLGCIFRDSSFPSRWIFKAVSYPAQGRTCKDLVDECQELQPTLTSGAGPANLPLAL